MIQTNETPQGSAKLCGVEEQSIPFLERPNSTTAKPQSQPSFDFGIVNSETISKTVFAEPEWLAEGLFPAGLSLLAGHPKCGKSWLALSLSHSIATGSWFLDKYLCPERKTLFLGLEDSASRIQRRLKMLELDHSPNLDFGFSCPMLDKNGFEKLDNLLSKKGYEFLVLDTVARCQPVLGGTSYQSDTRFYSQLQQITNNHNCSCLCILHLSKDGSRDKFQSLNSSMGSSGCADLISILERKPDNANATLLVSGRDVENAEIPLRFEQGKFELTNNEPDLTSCQADILDLLNEEGGMPLKSSIICYLLSDRHPSGTVKTTLRRQEGRLWVKRDSRGYTRATSATDATNLQESQ